MFYISRKVGKKYGVVDTNDNSEEFHSMKSIREYLDLGVTILGASIIRNRLVIVPYKLIDNKMKSAKSKLLTGYNTGYKGFNIEFKDDEVIALELTSDFKDEVKQNSMKGYFNLVIPDIVTRIDDMFFENVSFSSDYLFNVVLPENLVSIGRCALFNWRINSIKFRGNKLRRIERGFGSKYSLRVKYSDLDNNTLNVNVLETHSLFYIGNVLNLPNIDFIDDFSITSTFGNGDNLSIYLGNYITKLNNIIEPFFIHNYKFSSSKPKMSIAKSLMSNATIIYLDDSCSLDSIDFSASYVDVNFSDELYCNAYIFVMSTWLYEKLMYKFTLSEYVAVGIILVNDFPRLYYLQSNLGMLCKVHTKYFKEYLDEKSLGKVKILTLK